MKDFAFSLNAEYDYWDDELGRIYSQPTIRPWLGLKHANGLSVLVGDIDGRRMPISRGIANNPALQPWSSGVGILNTGIALNPVGGSKRDIWHTALDGQWSTQWSF